MQTPAQVRKILDISTAHISEVTSWYLDEWQDRAGHLATGVIVYVIGDTGWLIWVPDTESPVWQMEHLPQDLCTVLKYAADLDCDWVMLDRDGVIIDQLPHWDW